MTTDKTDPAKPELYEDLIDDVKCRFLRGPTLEAVLRTLVRKVVEREAAAAERRHLESMDEAKLTLNSKGYHEPTVKAALKAMESRVGSFDMERAVSALLDPPQPKVELPADLEEAIRVVGELRYPHHCDRDGLQWHGTGRGRLRYDNALDTIAKYGKGDQ